MNLNLHLVPVQGDEVSNPKVRGVTHGHHPAPQTGVERTSCGASMPHSMNHSGRRPNGQAARDDDKLASAAGIKTRGGQRLLHRPDQGGEVLGGEDAPVLGDKDINDEHLRHLLHLLLPPSPLALSGLPPPGDRGFARTIIASQVPPRQEALWGQSVLSSGRGSPAPGGKRPVKAGEERLAGAL